MKIAIDLDEVLAEFLQGLIKYHNQRFGSSFKKEDFFTYHFWEVWGGDLENAKKIIQDFYACGAISQIAPVKGAIKGIKKISKTHKPVYIITSRNLQFQPKTEKWLTKYFDNFYQEIIFTSDFYQQAKRKDDVCLQKNIKLIVEDNSDYARECAEKGIKVILFDKPWNQKLIQNKNIIRVYSWPEITAKINELNN